MKEKAIEKVPYLKPKKPLKAEYTCITAVKIISHEKHLILDVFKKGDQNIPVVRIVLTKKDFGTFWPEKGWTRQKVENYWEEGGPVWEANRTVLREEDLKKRNVLESTSDLERIEEWTNYKPGKYRTWWNCVYQLEDKIERDRKNAESERKRRKRQEELNDRLSHVKPIPKTEKFAKHVAGFMAYKHILYYKKHGSYVDIACTACEQIDTRKWKPGTSFESQFERSMPEPRSGGIGICPMCGGWVTYKCKRRERETKEEKRVYLAEKYKENGLVVRYMGVLKRYWLETDENGNMSRAWEKIEACEIARAYFDDGKYQVDYQKYNPYTLKEYWDDCNLSGINNIILKRGEVLPESYTNMVGTKFQYCAAREYGEKVGTFELHKYLLAFQKYPQVEMVVKMNLINTVTSLMENEIAVNGNATRMDEFLKINKNHIKQLRREKGSAAFLRAMKLEKILGQNWTDEQVRQVQQTGLTSVETWERILRYMSLQQFLNRVEKYSKCQEESKRRAERMRHVAIRYRDYLTMRENLGYDLTNSIYQYPRNLEDAHAKMVLEQNRQGLEARIARKEMEFANIKEIFEKVNKYYAYEKDGLVVHLAGSAKEIIEEGKYLHHCVGGDNYLNGHNKGQGYILMIRKSEHPENPYITVEIDPSTNRIRQWYGAYDKKPDKEEIDEWLKTYVQALNQRKNESERQQDRRTRWN